MLTGAKLHNLKAILNKGFTTLPLALKKTESFEYVIVRID